MFRDEKYFFEELQKDTILHNVFNLIGDYSTTYNELFDSYESKQENLIGVINYIKSNGVNKGDTVIQSYIDKLIKNGLCKYVIGIDENPYIKDNSKDNNDIKRFGFYQDLGCPRGDTKITLTKDVYGCSGEALYNKIIKSRESEIALKIAGENISLVFEKMVKPYDDKIEKLTQSIEDKISEMNSTVDSTIIKNIQVISVFAGVITILFANIMGIKEFSNIGVWGLLLLNYSTVITILALVLLTKLIIVGGKIEHKHILFCLLIILIIVIPIILLNLNAKFTIK